MDDHRQAIIDGLSHNTHISPRLLSGLTNERLTEYYNRSTDATETFLLNWIGPALLVAGACARLMSPDTGTPYSLGLVCNAFMVAGATIWGAGIFRHVKEAGLTTEISDELAPSRNSPSAAPTPTAG